MRGNVLKRACEGPQALGPPKGHGEPGGDWTKLWMALYGMIWIVFFEFLLAMTPDAPTALEYLHVALGFAIVGLAYYDFNGVRQTAVPARVKRIANSTLQLSVAMGVLGLLLFFNVGAGWTILFGVTVWGLILFFHVVTAFAIITQAAAVAIAYDMWEDKEFVKETAPGEVPPMAPPKKPSTDPKS